MPSDFVDEPVLARLFAGQEVVLPTDHLHLPPGFRADSVPKNHLLLPLFLEQQPVTVQLTAAGAVARVSVHGQGPGISGEKQGHIWERLYRAKGTAVQHELDLSLGLGFYLSRAFIEGHHGSVGVQSEPGQGTTFWFTLPVEVSPQR